VLPPAEEPTNERRTERYVPSSTVAKWVATPYLFRSGFNARELPFCRGNCGQELSARSVKEGRCGGETDTEVLPGRLLPADRCRQLIRAGGWSCSNHRPRKTTGWSWPFRRDQSAMWACEGKLREIDPTKDLRRDHLSHLRGRETCHAEGSTSGQFTLEIDECPGLGPRGVSEAAALEGKSP